MSNFLKLLGVNFTIAVLTLACVAQDDPNLEQGMKAYGSYHGGNIDTVSLTNGNLMVQIPLFSTAQRGKVPVEYVILYNNKSWGTKSTHNQFGPSLQWDFKTVGTLGIVQAGSLGARHNLFCRPSDPECNTPLYNETVTSWDGSIHQMGSTSSTSYESIDGTGIRNDTSQGTVNASGIKNGTAFFEDSNGNQIGIVAGNYVDTLGRAMPNLTNPAATSGCPTGTISAYTWNFISPGGAAMPVKVCSSSYSYQTAFGVSGIAETSGTITLISAIVLPTAPATSYLFSYNSYLDLTSITLPTGGIISYDWQTITLCATSSAEGKSRAVHTRTVNANDGRPPSVWTYSFGAIDANLNMTNVVTDPSGNDTVHIVSGLAQTCSFYETKMQAYQGSSSAGTLLKSVVTEYANAAQSPFQVDGGANIAINVVPTRITTIWPDGNVSRVVRQYDQGSTFYNENAGPGVTYPLIYGSVTQEDTYDFGQNTPGVTDPNQVTPGPLLRRVLTTYKWQADANYKTFNLLTLPASVITQDGSNNRKAETDYQYDEVGLVASGVSTQRNANPANGNVRGNLTTLKRWLDTTNTFLSSTNTYFDTGMLATSTDPGLHKTQFFYGCGFSSSQCFAGAYLTQTKNAKNQTTDFDYDFATGLATATRDGNSQVTSTDYDSMWRSFHHHTPDLGLVTWNYTDSVPASFKVTKAITSTLNYVVETDLDGVARSTTTQTLSDPEGTDFKDVVYDPMGRVFTTSNPHRTGAAPTDGITTTKYDALSRPTMIIPPDGTLLSASACANCIKTSYSSNVSIVTDQAGKQRRTISDALGRVIEVDEPGVQPPAQANYATQQTDGNFVLYNSSNTALWSTSTSGTNASNIYMQDDGNLVLYIFKWQAGTYATPSPGPFPAQSCSIGSYLIINERINANQCIVSPHGQYMLYMAPDGNFFIYDIAHNVGTWGPGTQGHPGAYAILQGDGNFCIYDANNIYLWCSGTSGTFSERLNMEDDGRIIIYKSAWNSGTSTGQFNWTNLAHPGCDVGIGTGWTGMLGAGQCFVSPNGHFELLLQTDGSLVIYDLGATPPGALWSTNTAVTSMSPGYAAVTRYSYDTLNHLICVEQHGNTTGTGCSSSPSSDLSSPWRVRRFNYDSLSRMVSSSIPESGNATARVDTAYTYDPDGNLLTKTTAAPNQTGTATVTLSFCYEELHRMISKAYTNQACPMSSPVATYAYDQSSANGLTITNGIGRRTSMADQAGSEAWSYDPMGKPKIDQRTTNGVTKTTTYTYNLDGSQATIIYPSGRTIAYSYSGASRTLTVADTTNTINYATSALYAPPGGLSSVKNGSNLTSTFYYNNRLQPCRTSVTTLTGTPGTCADNGQIGNILDFTYGFNSGPGNNGDVAQITNNRDMTRTQMFTYDPLNRIATAKTNSTTAINCWGESFGYDPWGNLLTIGGLTGYSSCTQENLSIVATLKNQVSADTYDSAGNLINITSPSATYTYDAENHLTATAAGVTYIYDGDGKRVKKSSGKLYWYGMGSEALDETDLAGSIANGTFNEYIFFNGKRIARRDSSNSVFYNFSDHLGTSRVIVQSGQTSACYDADFFPFGGEKTIVNICSPSRKFTDKERDAESGLDYFGTRYYTNALGRFLNADTKMSSGKPTAPQSFNRYTYSNNNPVLNIDPDGRETTIFYRAPGSGGSSAGDFGHIFIYVRNGQTGKSGYFDFYPGNDKGTSVIGKVDQSRLDAHARLTIQTTPQQEQKMLDALAAKQANIPQYSITLGQVFHGTESTCVTQSENILKAGGLDFGAHTPTELWTAAYMGFGKDFQSWSKAFMADLATDPSSDRPPMPLPEGMTNPQPGKEYGNDPSGNTGAVDPNATNNVNLISQQPSQQTFSDCGAESCLAGGRGKVR